MDKRKLMDGDVPRYIRVYDSSDCIDRYTVCFTGKYRKKTGGEWIYLAMSESPYQGFGQHGFSDFRIDRPSYKHLGKRIDFKLLPEDCRDLVMSDYRDLWDMDK